MVSKKTARYEFSPDNGGTFVVHDYNRAKPFTNFLPGVAGLWGTPLWCFYANRGQAVASFGTRNKDSSIMEFQSANLHHRHNSFESFRTFIRIHGDHARFYEPFRTAPSEYSTSNRLIQTPYDLVIEEENESLGLRIKVTYFTIPGEPFAALARVVTLENRGTNAVDCQVIDGMPNVVPYGVKHEMAKIMPFITDGYLEIKNLDKRVPYFTIGNVPGDESQTDFVTEGHFYFAVLDDAGTSGLARAIVDPKILFGEYNDRVLPYAYLDTADFTVPERQDTICQTPCAFAESRAVIEAGASVTIRSMAGLARTPEHAVTISERAGHAAYFETKGAENRAEIMKIRDVCFVHGADRALDTYVQQCFLDNVLRGGLPVTLRAGDRSFVYHVFSRKHGDLERDYNFFHLEPTYFSQGNGNFRDVNQNRRNDVWFNPDVFDTNVRWFFNLIQLDGFNPLLCEGSAFRVTDHQAPARILEETVEARHRETVAAFLRKDFTPGALFEAINASEVRLTADGDRFLEKVLSVCEMHEIAAFGHGYWSDHWMYNFDLLDSFLALFPDRLAQTLVEDFSYTFWDTDVRVLPRSDKYVLNREGQVRHLGSIARDPAKAALISSRPEDRNRARTGNGTGEVYRTNLLGKIVVLLVNKIATLSPSGMGIEMDGGRPGWCDSVNGIPSLFAAGMPEHCKLIAVLRATREMLGKLGSSFRELAIPSEVHSLYRAVEEALRAYPGQDHGSRDFEFWDTASTAKERYRESTHMGLSGEKVIVTADELVEFLAGAESHLLAGLDGATIDGMALPATYVTHDAVEFAPIPDPAARGANKRNAQGLTCVTVRQFSHHLFAPFLEGVVYRMAIESEPASLNSLWEAVRRSGLYDQKLGMYKIDVGLECESKEQGRTGGWPRGWFENESIFVHVEYKYLLQALRSRLYDRFFADLSRCLPPYLDPDTYGRSPFENVSFIVCSAHERPSYHGRGMQPRLSGNNAELVNMALIMCFGHEPFSVGDTGLRCRLAPVLRAQWFTTKQESRRLHRLDGSVEFLDLPPDSFTALFLGHTIVTYENPSRANTFGRGAAEPVGYRLEMEDGVRKVVEGGWLPADEARALRDRRVRSVAVLLEPAPARQ